MLIAANSPPLHSVIARIPGGGGATYLVRILGCPISSTRLAPLQWWCERRRYWGESPPGLRRGPCRSTATSPHVVPRTLAPPITASFRPVYRWAILCERLCQVWPGGVVLGSSRGTFEPRPFHGDSHAGAPEGAPIALSSALALCASLFSLLLFSLFACAECELCPTGLARECVCDCVLARLL